MKRLWCALRGHKIDYFRPEPFGVHALAYHCDCGRALVSRKAADQAIDSLLEQCEAPFVRQLHKADYPALLRHDGD